MREAVRKELFSLQDKKYQKFSGALMPGVTNNIGIRIPALKKMAKALSRSDYQSLLEPADGEYMEEPLLRGFIIGMADLSVDERLKLIEQFVPQINNWVVCDCFCGSLKFAKKHQKAVWDFIQPYLVSDKEYELRFGIVMLMSYFIDETHLDEVLTLVDRIRHSGYYVKMAAAWAVSVCMAKFPQQTMKYLQSDNLDDFTHNKAIQKCRESFRVSPADKDALLKLKR